MTWPETVTPNTAVAAVVETNSVQDDPIKIVGTSHGYPIIWTFNNECYDLNQDGLYTATEHPGFDHIVKIGVYNDFIREIQVVDRADEILIAFNVLGDFYHDETRFPYKVILKERECNT